MRRFGAFLPALAVFVSGCPQIASDFHFEGDDGGLDGSASGDATTADRNARSNPDANADSNDGANASCPPSPPTLCNGNYVDTSSNVGNCNQCGHACTSSIRYSLPSCVCGACTFQCSPGYGACSGSCVNEQVDNENCGACGVTCTGSTSCSGGRCVGPSAVAVGFIDVWRSSPRRECSMLGQRPNGAIGCRPYEHMHLRGKFVPLRDESPRCRGGYKRHRSCAG